MTVTECGAAGCRTEIPDTPNSFICMECWVKLPSPLVAEFTFRRFNGESTTELQSIALAALLDQEEPTE